MSRFSFFSLSLVTASLAFAACTVGDTAPAPVVITAADLSDLPAGQDLTLDMRGDATYILDSTDAALDYTRMSVISDDGTRPLTELASTAVEGYELPADAIQGGQWVLNSGAATGDAHEETEGVQERAKLMCSSDGRLCLLCYYHDTSGKLLYCDVYHIPQQAN